MAVEPLGCQLRFVSLVSFSEEDFFFRQSRGACHVSRTGTGSWRSAQGFDLIPVSVSGEGVQEGGGGEQKVDGAGTPRRDMMCGENVFIGMRARHVDHTRNLTLGSVLSHTHVLYMQRTLTSH